MSTIKIHQEIAVAYQTVGNSLSENIFGDFKSVLNDKISEMLTDFQNYQCRVDFGDDMNFKFPADDAPDYFKNAWYDVTGKMSFQQRTVNFNNDFISALSYGYYNFETQNNADAYNILNNRVKNLGCAGCLQLVIRVQEQRYSNNYNMNNQLFDNVVKRTLDDLRDIMSNCLKDSNKEIFRQIELADIEFERYRNQIEDTNNQNILEII